MSEPKGYEVIFGTAGTIVTPLDNKIKAYTPYDEKLSDIQLTALDLYERGFNVIPLRPHEKIPYKLAPFFYSRLHHCGALCHHAGVDDITELFSRKNLGIMTGRTSGNLLALDCDSHEAFDNMGRDLAARGLNYWAITGHRGGAYLLRIIEGEAASRSKEKSNIADVEIWGNHRLIVMPTSVHPSGTIYQWRSPEPRAAYPRYETLQPVSIAALAWLGIVLELEDRKRWEEPDLFGLPNWAGGLSHANRETYAAKLSEGERNSKLTALAYDMAGNEIDYDAAEEVILDIARRSHYPQREAAQIVKSAYSQPRQAARAMGQGIHPWQRAKMYALTYNWRETFGRKALKREAAYYACIERARRDGRAVWRATSREIAELTNTDKKRAAEYLRDLAKEKLIKRLQTKQSIGYFKFILPADIESSSLIHFTPKTQGEMDTFGALGLVAWYVWRHLLLTPEPTIAAIARSTGRAYSSVYKAVKNLTRDGVRLVTIAEGMYYGESKTEASLQIMAGDWYNGASRSQARKEAHRIERERRVNKLIAYAIAQDERAQDAA